VERVLMIRMWCLVCRREAFAGRGKFEMGWDGASVVGCDWMGGLLA
jgi:hypothetical protein